MPTTDPQTLAHWLMLEQLLSEVMRHQWPYGPCPQNSAEVFDDLIKSYALFDPRFNAEGLDFDVEHGCARLRASLQPSTPCRRTALGIDAPIDGYYKGLPAIAHFFGVRLADADALLYTRYHGANAALLWLRAKTRRMEKAAGLPVPKEFWEGFPRRVKEMKVL
ncbi:hypothetical protein D3C85_955320 [compost metagenome]